MSVLVKEARERALAWARENGLPEDDAKTRNEWKLADRIETLEAALAPFQTVAWFARNNIGRMENDQPVDIWISGNFVGAIPFSDFVRARALLPQDSERRRG